MFFPAQMVLRPLCWSPVPLPAEVQCDGPSRSGKASPRSQEASLALGLGCGCYPAGVWAQVCFGVTGSSSLGAQEPSEGSQQVSSWALSSPLGHSPGPPPPPFWSPHPSLLSGKRISLKAPAHDLDGSPQYKETEAQGQKGRRVESRVRTKDLGSRFPAQGSQLYAAPMRSCFPTPDGINGNGIG